ncbi:hypothetical protein D3C76_1063950 [compost metagenome]
MAASVGPYRLYRLACGRLRRVWRCSSIGSASPLQMMRVREVQAKASSAAMNAESIDGTKCSVVIACSTISAARRCGSRCSPGAAITRVAPFISGQKNSHTDTSKLNGVFCSTRSVGRKS